MNSLETDEIIHIHDIVAKKFNTPVGILNKGLLDSISKRPDILINDQYPYDDIFKKAASLMEGIIRLHPFADGNKRTALLTTVYFLKLNGYGIVLPLSSVRYSVQIAKNNDISQQETEKLIRTVARWLKNHSGKTKQEFQVKYIIYVNIPYSFLLFIAKIGFAKYVAKKIGKWMAFDIYPEYVKDANQIVEFINETMKSANSLFDDDK